MKPDTRNAFVGTCPVCEGAFKLSEKSGFYAMVHHGYKRPGDGAIHGDCFAVGYEPYERSCEGTKAYKSMVERSRTDTNTWLLRLEQGDVTHLSDLKYRGAWNPPETVDYYVGVTELSLWMRELARRIGEARYRLQTLDREIKRAEGLIANWTLKDITVTVEAIEHQKKAERDARAAVRQAARDEKAAKAKALADKRAQAEQERAMKRAEFAAKFQAFAAAGDRVGALALWAELGRAKNKGLCKYQDYSELGCNDALLALRLARTSPGLRPGYLIYGPC